MLESLNFILNAIGSYQRDLNVVTMIILNLGETPWLMCREWIIERQDGESKEVSQGVHAMLQVRWGGGVVKVVDEDVKKWLGFEKYMSYLLRIRCKGWKKEGILAWASGYMGVQFSDVDKWFGDRPWVLLELNLKYWGGSWISESES